MELFERVFPRRPIRLSYFYGSSFAALTLSNFSRLSKNDVILNNSHMFSSVLSKPVSRRQIY